MSFRNNQGTHNTDKYLYMCKCFIVLMVLWGYNVGAEETYVVRKANWGMTPEQVRKSETWKAYADGLRKTDIPGVSYLGYHGSLLGFRCGLQYQFEGQKLRMISYAFVLAEEGVFKLVKELLVSKYGRPIEESKPGHRDTHDWITKDGRTRITLYATGRTVAIFYHDKKHADRKSKERWDKSEKQIESENPF